MNRARVASPADITAIVLTKDEEGTIAQCLQSLAWCRERVVVDSGSSDGTCAIAEQHGAQVYSHAFAGFGQQRNWALAACSIPTTWVLFLDADEIATPEFSDAVLQAIRHAPDDVAGFYCCWKMMLGDTWLRRSDSFPKWQFRLLRKGRASFVDAGHGQKEGVVNGRIEYIREPYLHFAFSKGWSHWIERHNRYSTAEAIDRLRRDVRWSEVFSRHAPVRNRALKCFGSKLPGWPLLRFFHSFILKLGFLDGRAGMDYAVMLAYFEFTIRLKMRELRRARPAGLDS